MCFPSVLHKSRFTILAKGVRTDRIIGIQESRCPLVSWKKGGQLKHIIVQYSESDTASTETRFEPEPTYGKHKHKHK